jgi:hypothetical protein
MVRIFIVLVAGLALLQTVAASERTDAHIAAVTEVEFEISPRQKYENEEPPDRELLTVDGYNDKVLWVRIYGKKQITQEFSILRHRARMDDTVATVPLKWLSIKNPSKMDYNPDKHDVGLRINKIKDGRYVLKFYSVDSAGQEVELKFVEQEE